MWVKTEVLRAGLEVEVINIDHDEKAKQRILEAGFLSVPVFEYEEQLIGYVQSIISHIAWAAE